jgi:hypothetical protein
MGIEVKTGWQQGSCEIVTTSDWVLTILFFLAHGVIVVEV